jgi:hypothetical protein
MTTHPVIGWAYGYLGYQIFYKHFYFHQGQVLHMKAFALSTAATTIDDGGKPRGSTELADVTGHNCAMSQDEYVIFAMLVLGLRPKKSMAPNKGTVHLSICSSRTLFQSPISLLFLPSMSPQVYKLLSG